MNLLRDAEAGNKCFQLCLAVYNECYDACEGDNNCRLVCSRDVESCVNDWNGTHLIMLLTFSWFYLEYYHLSPVAKALVIRIARMAVQTVPARFAHVPI